MASWTQDELDAIEKAYRSGVRVTQYRDRRFEFRSLEEMARVIAEGKRSLSGHRRRAKYVTTDRGYQ